MLEKTETHVLELDNFICKLHSSHTTIEKKNIQKGRFRDSEGEQRLDVEMDLGPPLQFTESHYTLTLINSKAKDNNHIEVVLSQECFSSLLEFMGRSVRQY